MYLPLLPWHLALVLTLDFLLLEGKLALATESVFAREALCSRIAWSHLMCFLISVSRAFRIVHVVACLCVKLDTFWSSMSAYLMMGVVCILGSGVGRRGGTALVATMDAGYLSLDSSVRVALLVSLWSFVFASSSDVLSVLVSRITIGRCKFICWPLRYAVVLLRPYRSSI